MCFLKFSKISEPPSPQGIIKQEDVVQTTEGVLVKNVPLNLWLTTVANTNSMLPIIDYGDIAILTDGFEKSQLVIGDIIVYQAQQSIIHRIVGIQETASNERVYTLQGDNNAGKDPYQILDEHISWLLVGIIYCKK